MGVERKAVKDESASDDDETLREEIEAEQTVGSNTQDTCETFLKRDPKFCDTCKVDCGFCEQFCNETRWEKTCVIYLERDSNFCNTCATDCGDCDEFCKIQEGKSTTASPR